MGRILTRAVLHAQGYSQRRIDTELRAGPLRRIAHGAYTREPRAEPWVEHRLLIDAVGARPMGDLASERRVGTSHGLLRNGSHARACHR